MQAVTLTIFVVAITCALAQVATPGTPISWAQDLLASPPFYSTGRVDVYALMEQDEMNMRNTEVKMPYSFGYQFFVNLTTNNSGLWTTEKSGKFRVWRLGIRCQNAYSINMILSQYHLPEGASLYIYNPSKTSKLGAFTSLNNKPTGMLAIQPFSGTELILEYNEPLNVEFKGKIAISTIVHAYRPLFNSLTRGPSDFCNINVACPEGAPWRDEAQSVAIITTSGGRAVCTGSIVNNVAEDFKPYFLTASHCLGNPSEWVFIFNYQSATCEGDIGPRTDSVSGGTIRARGSTSDFALIELSRDVPQSYNPYYAGWSAVDVPATSSVGISHPSGDIKKIAINDDPVTSSEWTGTIRDTHWRVNFWDDGTTEGGSSGSGLFDQNGRIVGQLHGGLASCFRIDYDLYGKLSYSWNRGSADDQRLDVWLDPAGTGTTILDGKFKS